MPSDAADLLVIAREMKRAGAGVRSLTEPFLATTSDFAEVVFAIIGRSGESCRILKRTVRGHTDAKTKGVKFKLKVTP